MPNPRLSVITPCHPSEDLTTVSQSIQCQTFKDFEWILLYDTRGRQQSPLRNAGAKRAAGKYVFFLDADIKLQPHTFESLLLNIGPFAFAYCQWKNEPIVDHKSLLAPIIVGEPLSYKRLKETNYISTNSLVLKDAFDDIGGFDESLPRFQDWDLFLSLMEKGYQGAYIEQVLFETGQRHSKIFNNDGTYPNYEDSLKVLRQKHNIR